MKKLCNKLLSLAAVLSLLVLVWFAISWFDIVTKNTTTQDYMSFNAFVLFEKHFNR